MDGAYRIDTDHIRALALQCHAFDLQFDELFNSDAIGGFSQRSYDAYNRLLSRCLLNLAISIRVSLRADPNYTRTDNGIGNCGLFEDGGPSGDGTFSIKDVCDKLIHADSISKPIERGARGSCCKLIGTYHGKRKRLADAVLTIRT